MRNYKVAAILAYLERGGLEKQRGDPHRSSYNRGNTAYASKDVALCYFRDHQRCPVSDKFNFV